MKNTKTYIITTITIGLVLAIYQFKPGNDNFMLLTDIVALVLSIGAVIFGILAVKTYGMQSLHGRSLILILYGISIWALAESIWVVFFQKAYLVVETLRFVGYIPATIGFFHVLKVSDPKYREKRKSILLFLYAFLIFSITYILLTPFIFGNKSLLDSITVNGYIIADFSLLFGIFLLLKASYSYRGGQLSQVWKIFALSYLMIFVFDIYFALNWETYYFGHFIEVLWLINYILVALGFYYSMSILKGIKESLQH